VKDEDDKAAGDKEEKKKEKKKAKKEKKHKEKKERKVRICFRLLWVFSCCPVSG